ncbi:MAG: ShlB/FhaC/HecB family hemolysin secretion/activation protein, partial [Pseudomonadota bacterium]
ANFNTAKRTRLTFGRGDEADTLDAEIEVRDRRPDQVYAWANNTGSSQSTRSRLGVGYQHRNVFDRDHTVTATYSVSPEDTDRVRQYGVNYQIPVYRTTGMLGLFRIESDIDTGRVANVFDVSGGGSTTGIRYSQVLNKVGDYRQRLYLDVIDKLFDNDVDFEGTNVGVDIRSRPISLSYQVEWTKQASTGRINLGYAQNLDGGQFNEPEDYALARFNAPQDWSAVRFNAEFDFSLPRDWSVGLNLNGQLSDDPLIDGEQLGIGGTIGPRGFEEREGRVDTGLVTRLQLWAPPTKDDLRFGAFVDHGFGDLNDPQEGDMDDLSLTSVGLSASWQWKAKLVMKADLGYVLSGFDDREDLSQDGDSRAHLSLVYRFF